MTHKAYQKAKLILKNSERRKSRLGKSGGASILIGMCFSVFIIAKINGLPAETGKACVNFL